MLLFALVIRMLSVTAVVSINSPWVILPCFFPMVYDYSIPYFYYPLHVSLLQITLSLVWKVNRQRRHLVAIICTTHKKEMISKIVFTSQVPMIYGGRETNSVMNYKIKEVLEATPAGGPYREVDLESHPGFGITGTLLVNRVLLALIEAITAFLLKI